jgi:hypothetical protein
VHKRNILILAGTLLAANAWGQDWKAYSTWCVNDTGSSHRFYMLSCRVSDQYDSVSICQRDAASHNPDHGKAVKAITDAGRLAVDEYMEDKKPKRCKSSK